MTDLNLFESKDLLLADEKLRNLLGDHGKKYVTEHYSWDTIEKTYADFIMQMGSA